MQRLQSRSEFNHQFSTSFDGHSCLRQEYGHSALCGNGPSCCGIAGMRMLSIAMLELLSCYKDDMV